MSTSTKNNFNQALRDLKEINEALFYKELKEKMGEHEKQLELEYNKVAQKARQMHEQMQRFEHNFNMLTQNVSAQFYATLQNLEEEVPAVFEGQTAMLHGAYEAFSKIAKDQSELLVRKDAEWRDLAVDVKEKHQQALRSLAEQLNAEVDRHSQEMKAEQNKNLQKLLDDAEKQRQEVSGEASLQLAAFGNQVQNQRQQLDSVLEALADGQEQFQNRFEALQQNFKVETNERLQNTDKQIKLLEKSVQDASEADAVRVTEFQEMLNKHVEEQSVQLAAIHQLQQEKWDEQDSKLDNLNTKQQSQTVSVKRWMIGLVISQIIMISSIIGLYFW